MEGSHHFLNQVYNLLAMKNLVSLLVCVVLPISALSQTKSADRPHIIGIDEISVRKGHDYRIVVSDLKDFSLASHSSRRRVAALRTLLVGWPCGLGRRSTEDGRSLRSA